MLIYPAITDMFTLARRRRSTPLLYTKEEECDPRVHEMSPAKETSTYQLAVAYSYPSL